MQTKGFTYGTIIMYTQSIPLLWVGTIARLDCWTHQTQKKNYKKLNSFSAGQKLNVYIHFVTIAP